MHGILEHTYEIEAQLGAGGCGAVYKAWHKRLEKHMVLKELKNSAQRSAGEQRNEIEALKNIKCLYIPQVFDFLINNNNCYTVIEYIEGISFDKLLGNGEVFAAPQIARWYYQLSAALKTLHDNDICHRDIKPGNIIKTVNGDACLIDFNNALVNSNRTGVVGRSLGYASPEQYEYFQICRKAHTELAKDNQARYQEYKAKLKKINIDWKLSDIYSLGATMYHLFTGRRPHIDISSQFNAELCDCELSAVIKRSMMHNPAERYTSAHELGRELEKLFAFSD